MRIVANPPYSQQISAVLHQHEGPLIDAINDIIDQYSENRIQADALPERFDPQISFREVEVTNLVFTPRAREHLRNSANISRLQLENWLSSSTDLSKRSKVVGVLNGTTLYLVPMYHLRMFYVVYNDGEGLTLCILGFFEFEPEPWSGTHG